MLKILSEDLPEQVITPTIFPDGTSQVWKINAEQYTNKIVGIDWYYESEAELIQLLQLRDLLMMNNAECGYLFIPYFPYARQDKNISDTSTFARSTFIDVISTLFDTIITLDVHSQLPKTYCDFINIEPTRFIDNAIREFSADVLVFPDAGAYARYGKHYSDEFDFIVLDKVRNQLTGDITGLTFNQQYTSEIIGKAHTGKYRLLIIDDICDGGATFIGASTFLHENYDCEVGLYVTHGIFSKGYEKMIDSGISKFYTTKSLVRNVNGYDLEVKGV